MLITYVMNINLISIMNTFINHYRIESLLSWRLKTKKTATLQMMFLVLIYIFKVITAVRPVYYFLVSAFLVTLLLIQKFKGILLPGRLAIFWL